ncbi:MAG: tetratricopeptide repeat protein, partial [Bacteroidota bacterium]
MKPFLTALLIAAVCLGAHAQNTSEQEQIQQRLDSLLDESAYQTMYELSDSAAQFNLLNDTARYYRCVALTYDPEIGLDSALNCLNEVHEVYGYNTSGYYNTRSWLFLLNEEYDSSFATVEQGLSLYPDTAYLYATKADVLFSLGDVEQAAILRQQVLDSGDAYPHHYGMQGDYYYDQSDPRAIDLYLYCADSLAQEPKEELGYRYTAGLSAQISGEFQRAIDILEQVIEEQRPPDHHTYSVLSLSYCGLHQFEEALALAKRAESLHKTKKLQSSNDEGLWFDEFYLKDKDHIQVICRWFPRDRDDLFYRHVF